MKGCIALLFILLTGSIFSNSLANERNWSNVWKELENISYQQHDIFERDGDDSESFWQGVQYAGSDLNERRIQQPSATL